LTKKWPDGHLFLFHKQRVRFFGMCEQSPIPDGTYEPVDGLVLCHQPKRKSFSLQNSIFRAQSRNGRAFIVECLLGKPTDLNCWRWDDEAWPLGWEQIRRRPFWTAFKRLLMWPQRALRHQWRRERKLFPLAAICGPLYHALICFKFWRSRRKHPKAID
jgi:hypothetical protein